MKILGMSLSEQTVAACMADTHLVVGCEAADGDDLFEYIDCEAPDILAVDIDAHAWFVSEMEHLRHRNIRVPIVGLVSTNCKAHGERRAEFLEAGGNDLLEKPVSVRELMASMDSLRRLYSYSMFGRYVEAHCGSAVLRVDTARHQASVDGVQLKITPLEYKLFELLMLHKNQVVSKKLIQDNLYSFLDVPENNCVQVLMVRIRRKIEAVNPDTIGVIETIRREGYCLAERQ